MSIPVLVIRPFVVLMVAWGLVVSQASRTAAEQAPSAGMSLTPAAARAPFAPPAEDDLPPGPLGDAIRYGHRLLTQTQVAAKDYVSNGLNCTSCHLNAGRAPHASPWVGVWGVFPGYNPRSGRIISLQDRINA